MIKKSSKIIETSGRNQSLKIIENGVKNFILIGKKCERLIENHEEKKMLKNKKKMLKSS